MRFKKKWYGFLFGELSKKLVRRDFLHRNMKICNSGSILFKTKEVSGNGNCLSLGKNSLIYENILIVKGDNNKIIIGDNCKLGKNCKLYVLGSNCELRIGNKCTFSHDVELLVQENDSKIIIGEDCMFSHHINVRTSDEHSVYDKNTGKRSNQAKDVFIGNHVWVTPEVIIHKGCSIGNGVIIATRSIVTKDIPDNALAAGMPAKVLKQNICWGRSLKNEIIDSTVTVR